MARKRTKADEVYNARKRYTRAAERNLKRAMESVGVTAERYRRQAEQELRQAVSTYDTSKKINFSKGVRNLAKSLNINLETEIQDARKLSETEQRRTISRSFSTLESSLYDDDIRREQTARTILANPTIGSRIYGGLVEVWRDSAATVWDEKQNRYKVDNEKINEILVDYFNVESIADVLEILESEIGERLYQLDENGDIYDVVKLLIQTKIEDDSLVI